MTIYNTMKMLGISLINELNLERVLMSGQAFRWRMDDEGWWLSSIGCDGAVLRACQGDDGVVCEAMDGQGDSLAAEYFRLDIELSGLRNIWETAGETDLCRAVDAMAGLRIVRQDPVECLISFLCSSAAPIHRIRKSVEGMCTLLGKDLGVWHGIALKAFPRLEDLARVPRSELDRLGLGFRGRYVVDSASEILGRGGEKWLAGLRSAPYADAKSALVSLPGVGEKIADCVCLFSLNKDEAVPIDVHMARVARREFEECRSLTTLTPKAYAVMAECFRARYGEYAGWAQQYFFYVEIERRGLWDQELGKHRPKRET
jgi:N-glycosylase/DNA lyase